jgi:hypothetical protein
MLAGEISSMNDRNDDEALARRTTGQRLAGAGLLAVTVLTSLGHGAGGNPFVHYPDPDTCVAGTLRAVQGGDLQTGYPGTPLARPLTLSLTCRGSTTGNTIAAAFNSEPRWSIASGGGTLDGKTQTATQADYDGLTQVHWSLGDSVGNQSVLVTLVGQSFTFSAMAVPPSASGTCTDLVATTGTNFEPERQILGSETWTLAGSPYRGKSVEFQGSTLRIEPGVQVCLERLFVRGGQLIARGTAQAPIRFSKAASGGLSMQLGAANSTPPSELVHTVGDGISEFGVGQPALVEDSVFVAAPEARCRRVHLAIDTIMPATDPIIVRRTSFDGFGSTDPYCTEAVLLYRTNNAPLVPSVFSARVTRSTGTAVRVHQLAGPWALQQCELTGSSSHGLVLDANSATVSGCSIQDNGGNGVHNTNPAIYTVNARGNWWGDATGPLGAAGDGVSAGVDAAQPLAAKPVLGY